MSKPRFAVYKFSSCDGCQLSILNLEDELLELADSIEIAYFLEATSRMLPEPYDVALVEGSISTPHEARRIQEIRRQARFLVALGTCATCGGIQALRNFGSVEELAGMAYEHPDYLDTLPTSTPLSDHVKVDLELWGCPVSKNQLVDVVTAVLHNRRPHLGTHSVCLDCKRNGTLCILVADGMPCLGPITRSGCGAICPGKGRGCYGCFGPSPQAVVPSLMTVLKDLENYPGETVHLLRSFTCYAPVFRKAADQLLTKGGAE